MLQPIPAIDIINGQCVRLTQGDYSSTKIYDESPVRIACQFEKAGFRRLHLVDLDGAKSAHVVNLNVLKEKNNNLDMFNDKNNNLFIKNNKK